jgi:hypothetical protein
LTVVDKGDTSILGAEASLKVRVVSGLSRAEFALRARPGTTNRAKDSLYLLESGLLLASRLLSFHGWLLPQAVHARHFTALLFGGAE